MVQLTFRFPKSMIDAVDGLRHSQIDPPERATVVRRLLAEALQARAARKGRKG